MNNVSMVGRLARDPELRYTPTGIPFCFFTLAVDRDYKDKEGKRVSDFIMVKAWRKLAENTVNYVTKGRLISVTGRIENESYTGKDGNKKYVTEVVADTIRFLSPRKETGEEVPDPAESGGGEAPGEKDFVDVEVGREEVPF